MTVIRRPSPFGELLSLRQAMDHLLADSFVRPRAVLGSEEHPVALDIRSTADEVIVEAALPGVKPEDVEITVLGDQLSISAASATEQSAVEDGYSHREIRRGSFSRSVTLPVGVRPEQATASFENGLLRLSIPKAEQAKPHRIVINPTAAAQTDDGEKDS